MPTNPLALLDRMLLASRPLPPNPVREHLCRLGYSSVAIVDILCHIDATGSPRCASLEEEDAAGVEELLAGETACVDGCKACAEEAAWRASLLRGSVGKRPDDSDLANAEGF
jgi:hypothetical protein